MKKLKNKIKKKILMRYFNAFVALVLIFILSGLPSFAAEKVYFYHTDAAGTPVAMTDASGAKVWETDYKPFGEEQSIIASTDNNKKFIGKEKDEETGLYYFGARYMDAGIGRFTSVDPAGITEKDLLNPQRLNRYSYGLNNPYRYIDLDGRDAIAIVFKQYKIATPIGRIGGIGHAGALLINNKTGVTKYYEYGRYDKEGKGLTRKISVPDVTIDSSTGKPTKESLDKTLSVISQKAGHGGPLTTSYIDNENFEAMNKYAINRLDQNSNPDREEYSLLGNNCGHFMKQVIEAGGVDMPAIIDPRPNTYIDRVKNKFD